jgi:hypothetical protein
MSCRFASLTQKLLAGLSIPLISGLVAIPTVYAHDEHVQPLAKTQDVEITAASVRYLKDLDLLVFQQQVTGRAGATTPQPHGELDGAPVLGYVFPITLQATDVGFSQTEGTLALAVTSHPDFDDTPFATRTTTATTKTTAWCCIPTG